MHMKDINISELKEFWELCRDYLCEQLLSYKISVNTVIVCFAPLQQPSLRGPCRFSLVFEGPLQVFISDVSIIGSAGRRVSWSFLVLGRWITLEIFTCTSGCTVITCWDALQWFPNLRNQYFIHNRKWKHIKCLNWEYLFLKKRSKIWDGPMFTVFVIFFILLRAKCVQLAKGLNCHDQMSSSFLLWWSFNLHVWISQWTVYTDEVSGSVPKPVQWFPWQKQASLFNAVPPESPMITGIQYWFLAYSLVHKGIFLTDFPNVLVILCAIDDESSQFYTEEDFAISPQLCSTVFF